MITQNTNEDLRRDNKATDKGLDKWNERLDNNLETEQRGNIAADIRAENYSNEQGSGDQSDNPENSSSVRPEHESEDNMAKNHPRSKDPGDHLDREE